MLRDPGEEQESDEEPEFVPAEADEDFLPLPVRIPLKTKVTFWLVLGGAMVAGTFLFLFFITAFVYFFLPLVFLLLLWNLVRPLFRK